MSSSSSSSSATKFIGIAAGVVLMVAGSWVHLNWHPEFYENLEKQGVPLDLGLTVATIGVFLILFPIIDTFFIKPLQQAINDRNTHLSNTFSEVESLRSEMTTMKSDYEKRLADTEADAREKINSQIKEAQNLRQSLLSEATAKSDGLIKAAQTEIAGEKARAMTEIRVHVSDLALTAAEKVVGKNMDTDLNRKLISDFITDLEVAK
jgi:F-type H+-transporting ATPase subunit b